MNHDLLASFVMSLNVLFTVLRVVANGPQLIAVLRDRCGARAISVGSWTVFAMANFSNGLYALVMASDGVMFATNLVSALSCAAIAMVAFSKQRQALAEATGGASRAAGPAMPRSDGPQRTAVLGEATGAGVFGR